MVQNIRIEGEKVLFRLVFQKASDPFVGSVKKKAEALIKEKTSYTEVEIENLFVQDLERPLSLEKVKMKRDIYRWITILSNIPVRLAIATP